MNHGDIVRPVTHSHGLAHRQSQFARPGVQRIQLHLLGHDVAQHFAGEHAVARFQAVGQTVVDMRIIRQTVHDLMESSRHHADLPAVRVQRVDQLMRAVREMDTPVHLVEHGNRQTLQQRHACTQRLAEVQLAAHRLLGHAGDPLAATGGIAQLVDHFLIDQRGIDIHHQKTGTVEGRLGGCGAGGRNG